MFIGKKKKNQDLHIYRGGNLSCVADNSDSILILDFLDLIHEQAATVSLIAHTSCPAFLLGTDLLFPVFHSVRLCLAVSKAVSCMG